MAKEFVVNLWGQKVALVKEPMTIQMQVENDDSSTYVNLNLIQVIALKESLDAWLNQYKRPKNEEDHNG